MPFHSKRNRESVRHRWPVEMPITHPLRRSCLSALRTALLSAPIVLAAGCFAYQPTGPNEIRVNDDVRALLTSAQVGQLDPVFLKDGRTLEGKVVENGEEVLIQVPVVSELRGARVQTLHQRVRIPRESIVDLQLRRLDRTRTGLLVGGGLALAAAIVVRELAGDSGGSSRRPNPDPPRETVKPLLRIPLSFGR